MAAEMLDAEFCDIFLSRGEARWRDSGGDDLQSGSGSAGGTGDDYVDCADAGTDAAESPSSEEAGSEEQFVVLARGSGSCGELRRPGDFVGFGEAVMHEDRMSSEAFVQCLRHDSAEELLLLIDRDCFEADLRASFRGQEREVWRQFWCDVPRQELRVDGTRYTDPRAAAVAISEVARSARSRREAALRGGSASAPLLGLQRLAAAGWQVVTSPVYLFSWLAGGRSPPAPGPRGALVEFLPRAGSSAAGADCVLVDNWSDEEVVSLAMMCQQPVLAMTFELISKQYANCEHNVHIGDSAVSPVAIDVRGTEEGGGEVVVTVRKSFRVFRITPQGSAEDIRLVAAELEVRLLAPDVVYLRLGPVHQHPRH
eukprot:TRINITY_DN14366_c0_g1_i1.p1 TRINITY_DN14366_c0_g1~~TRINITY_DN14366_c0_g1_i1.p1  ORF type:complete len:396 (+),score=130.13 TRINITY_DN14366_c0_g1_i1:84-1190(+)